LNPKDGAKRRKNVDKRRKKFSGMQIAVIILGAILLLSALGFGGYIWYEEDQHQKALEKYPVAYTDLIQTYAKKYQLDPYLVQSIMRCESSNDPNAVSHVGAIGLMQIMPDTGEWIGHKIDPELAYSLDMLNDPATNIEYGCWYLNFLSERFDGNVMEIIAAYNAGHGTVKGWLEDPRFSKDGELLTIPYEDTAKYYTNVMTAYENYTTLYPDLFTNDTQRQTVVGG
jgi:soluble lytic murein transglycosylase